MANPVVFSLLLIASCQGQPPWALQRLKIFKDNGSDPCFKPPNYYIQSSYRSYDGSCNNLKQPTWGIPYTPYPRTLPNSYSDGLYTFPRAVSGNELPSARKISTNFHSERDIVNPVYNLIAMQWGQFIAHDMSLTDDYALLSECCNNNHVPSVVSPNPHCAPIIIPKDDPFHGPMGHQCLGFMRTGTTWDHEFYNRNEPPEQISIVSAYMDLSMIYGVNEKEAMNLRNKAGGKLSSTIRSGQEFPPHHPKIASSCPFARSDLEPCYFTGDIRANQSPQLAILQIILLREHNRIADIFAKLNPHWDDETLYQEARKINIATYQHINYYEYLPILLGWDHMNVNKLIYPRVDGYVNDYDPSVNPSVSIEHATAAYRHFHSLVRGHLKLAAESRQLQGAIRLSDWFNRPLVLELKNTFNDLVRGSTVQGHDYSDQYFSTEITQNFFRRGNNTFGNDLRSMDIQRGRDHGLGKYVAARAACDLPVPKTFEDMTDFISRENILLLKSLYESPLDVELVVAGTLERLVPGTQAGPTYLCILTKQFYRTRVGDRYFYENGADLVTSFKENQLQSIKKGASMARLLCDNVEEIQHMQPHAFQIIGDSNQLSPCEELPAINLSLWQEDDVDSTEY